MRLAASQRPHGGVCNQSTLRRYGCRLTAGRGTTVQSLEAAGVGEVTDDLEGSFFEDPEPSLPDLAVSLAFEPSLFFELSEAARASVL